MKEVCWGCCFCCLWFVYCCLPLHPASQPATKHQWVPYFVVVSTLASLLLNWRLVFFSRVPHVRCSMFHIVLCATSFCVRFCCSLDCSVFLSVWQFLRCVNQIRIFFASGISFNNMSDAHGILTGLLLNSKFLCRSEHRTDGRVGTTQEFVLRGVTFHQDLFT